ncbi:MAG: hypothetical protein J6C78_08075 [Muribaculaceae bacterium]|nr:hypothetical protein [Muribaculaceae bacterium]
MKSYILKGVVIGATIFSLTACDENSWNDEYLDGFKEPDITDVQNIQYTLTAANYDTIANLAANKALAGDEDLSALLNLKKTHCFTEQINPGKYVPAFLASQYFPYFTLSDGSAVKLTYNMAEALPDEVAAYSGLDTYIVSDEDFQAIWDSADKYVDCFAPSKVPSRFIPSLLRKAYPDAETGTSIVVNYEISDQEPTFGGGDEPPVSEFVMSDVLGSVVLGDTYDVNGVVTGICTRGYVITDKGGSLIVYSSSFNPSEYKIGDQVVLNATASTYGKYNYIQLTPNEGKIVGHQDVEYPAPAKLDGAALDALLADILANGMSNAKYVELTGKIAVSGNNINLRVDGAENAVGSIYNATDDVKAKLTDGANVTVKGWLVTYSGSRYLNIVVTNVAASNASASTLASSRAADITLSTKNVNVIYTFNGTAWAAAPSNIMILSAADYAEMGANGALSTANAAAYLPIYLKQNLPYAQNEDVRFVVYRDNGSKAYVCDQYIYDGSAWTLNNGITEQSAQFVRVGGQWKLEPTVTINMPAGRNVEPTYSIFMKSVEWVRDNVPDGAGFIHSKSNAEYYGGTSAYYGNVDVRASTAKNNAPAGYTGYDGLDDEQITALVKKRFETEVMPGTLSLLFPDQEPTEGGAQVYYVLKFVAYDGTAHDETIRFKVASKGKFEYVECSWNDAE